MMSAPAYDASFALETVTGAANANTRRAAIVINRRRLVFPSLRLRLLAVPRVIGAHAIVALSAEGAVQVVAPVS